MLKTWEKHKQSGLFERFEVWTPEVQQPDPILVGINGNSRHLLARWNESGANLVSFDDIKRELVRRWYGDEPIGNEPWEQRWVRTQRIGDTFLAAIMSTFAILMVVGFGLSVLLRSAGIGFSVGVVVAVVAGATIFHYVRKNALERCLRMSDLMQAIAKDDSRPRDLHPA